MEQYPLYDGIVDGLAFILSTKELALQLLKEKINIGLVVSEDKIVFYSTGNPATLYRSKFEISDMPKPTPVAFSFAVSLDGEPIPPHAIHHFIDDDTHAFMVPMDLLPGGDVSITYTTKGGKSSKPANNKPHWANLNEKKRRHRF